MKTKHIRLCVWNTKNRLERKYERFRYIQNHEIGDNIRKSKKGERQRTEAILKYCKIEDDYFLTKSADGEKILKLIKIKFDRAEKFYLEKSNTFLTKKSEKFNAVFGQILGTFLGLFSLF